MADQPSPSLEDLIRQYNVVEATIPAVDLDTAMVLRFENELRVVISVAYEHPPAGPSVAVETAAGTLRFPIDAQVPVWHMHGEPFLVALPPRSFGPFVPARTESPQTPPAEDAAGIVPVWRGPKRII